MQNASSTFPAVSTLTPFGSGLVRASRVICAVALGGCLLTACSDPEDRVAFDGQYFKAKLSKVDKQRDQVLVEVTPASASLTGAREAGRFEATKYCVKHYGTSDVAWTLGPDVEDSGLRIEGDTLVLRGVCTP